MDSDGKVLGLDVGRMEAVLAAGLPGRPNEARLLHGDFWAGNMLWREGELVGVIDWGDAWLGDPLKDLGEARVEIVWLFGVEAAALFLETYQSAIDIDYRNLGYWDLCAVLRLLRLTEGNWGWLVDFAAKHGRGDLSAEVIGEGYGTFVDGILNG
jgi:aminoglycoside phosphotransferase (APT) family kinase protein